MRVIGRVVIYGVVVALVAVGGHQWVSDRLGVLRMLYPVEAWAAAQTIECSAGAPEWMTAVVARAVYKEWAPANQLVFIEPDGTVHHCENGWEKGVLQGERVDKRTRFRYASMTKLITAAAVLEQVREGRLRLEDRLIDFLPPLGAIKDPYLEDITVAHLLAHAGGFDRKASGDPMARFGRRPWCPGKMKEIANAELDFLPGTGSEYSNLGYCLLGVVLAEVSGASYKEEVSERYDLPSRGMKFVENGYFSDEIEYDFRNSNFFGRNYTESHDFNALASSAGLTGSALSLAELIRELIGAPAPNLLSGFKRGACYVSVPRSCFGYAFYQYQEDEEKLSVAIQSGLLYGVSGSVVVDEHGGVLVRIGNGSKQYGGSDEMNAFIYKQLSGFYQ